MAIRRIHPNITSSDPFHFVGIRCNVDSDCCSRILPVGRRDNLVDDWMRSNLVETERVGLVADGMGCVADCMAVNTVDFYFLVMADVDLVECYW